MAKKTIVPNDFRDFLAIASFLGLFGTFLLFVFGNSIISARMDAIFLIVSGAGLMVAGKVFEVKEWLSDGLQRNEITMVLSIIIGLFASVIGVLLMAGATLSPNITSLGGYVALASAIFIALDYLAKNTNKFF